MTEKLLFKFNQFIKARKEYQTLKKEYIKSIEEYCHNDINHTKITFKGNKMGVTFESFAMMSDKFMLKFCNEFGFLAPIIEYKDLGNDWILYKYKFIKIFE